MKYEKPMVPKMNEQMRVVMEVRSANHLSTVEERQETANPMALSVTASLPQGPIACQFDTVRSRGRAGSGGYDPPNPGRLAAMRAGMSSVAALS